MTRPVTATITRAKRAAYYRLFSADTMLRRALRPDDAILDVGCSDGRGSEVLTQKRAAGVDVYAPALAEARGNGRRTRVTQADVRRLPYRDNAFDVTVALDVVEHFTKPDALGMLSELERVARRLVVVVTPRGFLPQPPTEDEPWQEHRCGFEVDELAVLGYDVSGLGGPAGLRGPYGVFRFGALGQLGTVLTQPVTRARPHRAFALLATKAIGTG